MSAKIKVTIGECEVEVLQGTILSEVLEGEKPCGGHGKCGKCKIVVHGCISDPGPSEVRLLSPEELAAGVRLACLTKATGDCVVERLSGDEKTAIITDGSLPAFPLAPLFSTYGVAIDLGTTTLAARLYDPSGKLLAETARLNPQSKWGADVISRIESAMAGKSDLLADSIRRALDEILLRLAKDAGITPREIDGISITGNTTMLSLLCGESVEPLAHAPFAAKRLFGETLAAGELTFSSVLPETPVYFLPCIAAFVGADMTAALLAAEIEKNKTALLIDIGTNGEMALWHDGQLTVCSTAAGPAFEGIGISMGMRGAEGAIDKVHLSGGEWKVHVIGDTEPRGICGSGLVDAIACMLESEVIDDSGYLEEEKFVIRPPVSLTPKDVRMVQLAKSAISAGLLTLMENGRVTPEEISVLYIAGGFGNYLNTKSAAAIGLLPADLTNKVRFVGNAALYGAAMLLLNGAFAPTLNRLAENASVLDLSCSAVFSERYIDGIIFGKIECT